MADTERGKRKRTGIAQEPREGVMWLLAVGINVVILAALVCLMRPAFETNDDTALLTLVNGAKISSDPHMVISGIFLGRILMALYGITRALPWYTLVQYALLFLSFTGVTWVLLHRLGLAAGSVMTVLLVAWFGYESYIVIQFSRTAGIASASAMFLLFFTVSGDRKKHRIGSFLLALFLAVMASSVRFTQFLPCAALTTGIGLWMLMELFSPSRISKGSIYSRYSENGQGRVPGKGLRLVRLFAPFVLTGLLCFALRVEDKLSYRNDPVWRSFRDFDVLREELYDYGFPDYAANLETYRAAGISDAGYTLYRNWNFADPERFTVEVMEQLIAVKEERHFGKEVIRGFIREVPLKLVKKPVVWFWLFLLLAFLAGGKRRSLVNEPLPGTGRRRSASGGQGTDVFCETGPGIGGRSVLCILWSVLLFGVLYLYLYYNGRYLRTRVDAGLVYALCLTVLWFIRPKGVTRTWFAVPVMAAVLMFVPAVKVNYPFRFRASVAKKEKRQEKRRKKFEQLHQDPDHLYVMKMGAMIAHDCYGPFDVMPEKVIGNVIYLGGWAAYTKAFRDTMEAYDISNPYRDLIGNDRVYLVDNDIELTLTYLRENYDRKTDSEEVGKLGKYKIYGVIK